MGFKLKIGKGGFNPIKKKGSGGGGFNPIPIKAPKLGRVSFKPILKAAGTVTGSAANLVAKGTGKLRKLPVAGKPLSAAFNWTYGNKIKFIDSVVKGKRIDKASYGFLKNQIKEGQTLAPYVQTVVSTVPAVGPGLSGAIGAANALSKGRPIDEAVYEGIRDSIPGGPAARAAFEISYNLAKGRPVSESLVRALPVGEVEQQTILAGLSTLENLARGQEPKEAIVNGAIAAIPNSEARKAVQIGIAVAEGQNLQEIAMREVPQALSDGSVFERAGADIVKRNDFFKGGFEGLKNAGSDVRKGFVKGVGFMSYKSNPTALRAALKTIPAKQRAGFEMALGGAVGAAEVGRRKGGAKRAFGFALGRGLRGKKRMGRRKGKGIFTTLQDRVKDADDSDSEEARRNAAYARAAESMKKATSQAGKKAGKGRAKFSKQGKTAQQIAARRAAQKRKGKKKKVTRTDELRAIAAMSDPEMAKGLNESEPSWWEEFLEWVGF